MSEQFCVRLILCYNFFCVSEPKGVRTFSCQNCFVSESFFCVCVIAVLYQKHWFFSGILLVLIAKTAAMYSTSINSLDVWERVILCLTETWTTDPLPMISHQVETQFIACQPFPVSVSGLIPSLSTAPVQCWYKKCQYHWHPFPLVWESVDWLATYPAPQDLLWLVDTDLHHALAPHTSWPLSEWLRGWGQNIVRHLLGSTDPSPILGSH